MSVKQSRVPSGGWESRSIWHQMSTNIWVHNIGTCMISLYPSLHHRKFDWNRISWGNFAEISISEPFRSRPGSKMADRSQAFEMSIDAPIRHLRLSCALYDLQEVRYKAITFATLADLRASGTSQVPTVIFPNIPHRFTQMMSNEKGRWSSIYRHLECLAPIRHLGPWSAQEWLRNRDFRKILAGNAISVEFSMM